MPDENDTAWPPSSPPRTASKDSQVSVASVRLYRRSVPSTKFDAGTSGVFRGAPGTRSGRPPTMAQVSGFIGGEQVGRSARAWCTARVRVSRFTFGFMLTLMIFGVSAPGTAELRPHMRAVQQAT